MRGIAKLNGKNFLYFRIVPVSLVVAVFLQFFPATLARALPSGFSASLKVNNAHDNITITANTAVAVAWTINGSGYCDIKQIKTVGNPADIRISTTGSGNASVTIDVTQDITISCGDSANSAKTQYDLVHINASGSGNSAYATMSAAKSDSSGNQVGSAESSLNLAATDYFILIITPHGDVGTCTIQGNGADSSYSQSVSVGTTVKNTRHNPLGATSQYLANCIGQSQTNAVYINITNTLSQTLSVTLQATGDVSITVGQSISLKLTASQAVERCALISPESQYADTALVSANQNITLSSGNTKTVSRTTTSNDQDKTYKYQAKCKIANQDWIISNQTVTYQISAADEPIDAGDVTVSHAVNLDIWYEKQDGARTTTPGKGVRDAPADVAIQPSSVSIQQEIIIPAYVEVSCEIKSNENIITRKVYGYQSDNWVASRDQTESFSIGRVNEDTQVVSSCVFRDVTTTWQKTMTDQIGFKVPEPEITISLSALDDNGRMAANAVVAHKLRPIQLGWEAPAPTMAGLSKTACQIKRENIQIARLPNNKERGEQFVYDTSPQQHFSLSCNYDYSGKKITREANLTFEFKGVVPGVMVTVDDKAEESVRPGTQVKVGWVSSGLGACKLLSYEKLNIGREIKYPAIPASGTQVVIADTSRIFEVDCDVIDKPGKTLTGLAMLQVTRKVLFQVSGITNTAGDKKRLPNAQIFISSTAASPTGKTNSSGEYSAESSLVLGKNSFRVTASGYAEKTMEITVPADNPALFVIPVTLQSAALSPSDLSGFVLNAAKVPIGGVEVGLFVYPSETDPVFSPASLLARVETDEAGKFRFETKKYFDQGKKYFQVALFEKNPQGSGYRIVSRASMVGFAKPTGQHLVANIISNVSTNPWYEWKFRFIGHDFRDQFNKSFNYSPEVLIEPKDVSVEIYDAREELRAKGTGDETYRFASPDYKGVTLDGQDWTARFKYGYKQGDKLVTYSVDLPLAFSVDGSERQETVDFYLQSACVKIDKAITGFTDGLWFCGKAGRAIMNYPKYQPLWTSIGETYAQLIKDEGHQAMKRLYVASVTLEGAAAYFSPGNSTMCNSSKDLPDDDASQEMVVLDVGTVINAQGDFDSIIQSLIHEYGHRKDFVNGGDCNYASYQDVFQANESKLMKSADFWAITDPSTYVYRNVPKNYNQANNRELYAESYLVEKRYDSQWQAELKKRASTLGAELSALVKKHFQLVKQREPIL